MREILLTQGKIALIDDEDYSEIGKYLWFAYLNGYQYYAGRNERHKFILMHRQILRVEYSRILIDHKNGIGLDNRKENLRTCNHTQNKANAILMKSNTSGFKGVSYHGNRWRAYIAYDHQRLHIGCFDSAIDAAMAYDEAAKYFFGEFAKTNF